MNLRTLLLSLALLPIALGVALAQPRRIITGPVPSYLFADPATGSINALTAGVDNNFDGIYQPDSGDVVPHWYVIDAASESVRASSAFDEFFSSFPIRVGVDLAGRRLYIADSARIRAYNLDTRALMSDTVTAGAFAGVSFDSIEGRLAVVERPGFTQPGWMMLLDAGTLDSLARVEVGVSPSMTISRPSAIAGLTEYYTLSEGIFGTPTSLLSYTLAQPEIYTKMNGKGLTGGGTYIATKGDLAFVATGGGHRVNVIDTKTHKDLPYSPISFGASGTQNGPRTLAFQGDSILLVGTYSSQLMRVRIANGAIIDTIELRGKVETIAVRDSLAYVAIRNAPSNSSDSMVMIVNLASGHVVDSLTVGPQPIAIAFGANGDINVISMGTSDSTHTWMAFDRATHQRKSAHLFSGVLNNPFRYVDDAATDTLYAVVTGVVRAFSVADAGATSRAVYTPAKPYGTLNGISDGGEYLLAIESTGSGNGNEYLHVIDKSGQLLARFKTGSRPIMAARITPSHAGAIGIYVVDRGRTSAQSSGLDLYEFQPNILGSDTLGKGANQIGFVGNGVSGVTMNGSHAFLTVDLDMWRVTDRVATSTSGFDGPREWVKLDDDNVAVTTYTGDVRVLTISGLRATYPIGGKGEGIATLGGKVFVASDFAPTSFAPDSAVVVFDRTSLLASVERTDAIASATTLEQNYPNPASASTTVRFTLDRPAHVELALYSVNGELLRNVLDRQMESGSYEAVLNLNGLASGSYLYTLRSNGVTLSRTMKVVR